MADIDGLQDFARTYFEGLTAPLSPDHVEALASHWRPEMRFFEEEHFYPISLRQAVRQVENVFAGLDATEQDSFRVERLLRGVANAGSYELFDPPVLCVPDGWALVEVDRGQQTVTEARAAYRILSSGPLGTALELDDVDGDAVLTHGASFGHSEEFFGPRSTILGADTPSEGDPWRPRIEPMIVLAAFLNLLEALKYELLAQTSDGYPPDGLRGGFDIRYELFPIPPTADAWLTDELVRTVLLRLIEAYEANDQEAFADALDDLPYGWSLDKSAWDALTRFAFIEYYFFYPFNDFDRYQTTPFENEHEGDAEGCCLVFERNALNAAVASGSLEVLLNVTPHSILTSVHDEYQDADLHNLLPAGSTREELELVVWIAAGSHATYLSGGDHPLADWGDIYEKTEDTLSFLPVLGQALALVISAILYAVEHFVDTVDQTSDDGARSGPDAITGDHPNAVDSEVQVLHMSAEQHIYEPSERGLLRLRGYSGKWGGHAGRFDVSPPFTPKTGRYFRELMEALD